MKCINLLLLISSFAYSQEFKSIPDVFNKQCSSSLMEGIQNSEINLAELPSTLSNKYWIVYSDRNDNSFYNKPNESPKAIKASFMQGFLVKEVKNNWLHLFDSLEEEDYGWIKADKLLLSLYSLKTDGDLENGIVPIPKKAIILTSVDEAQSINGTLRSKKKYYSNPSLGGRYESGSPKSFQPLFVFKETKTAVLLAGSDYLDGTPQTNKSKVYGWIKFSDKKDWNTRVALENAQSNEAIELYGNAKLNGYETQNELLLCLNKNQCNQNTSLAQFTPGPTRNNVMRRPLLENVSANVKKIISVAKDNKNNKVYEQLLEDAKKLQSNVNIVFVLDATASMLPYYSSIAKSLQKVIDNNKKIIESNLKVGLVVYRDYADGKSAYSVNKLTTDINLVKKIINSTNCRSKDNDLPEAQFNGLINGLSQVGFKSGESNIVVLIGDCGNHRQDPKNYNINQVVDLFSNYNANIISFQVKSGSDDSFFTFNEDVLDLIAEVSKNKIKGKESNLKINLIEKANNTIKLKMIEGDKPDYENMFGLLVYADERASSTELLESTIESTLKDYMLSIANNINVLTQYVRTGGPTGSKPPEGLIVKMMDVFNCNRETAIDHLQKTEFTVEAFTAMDYFGDGVNAQTPVVLLTEKEKNNLVRSFRTLTSESYTSSQRIVEFQKNIVYTCKSIIGQNTSTEIIENLTLNQIWNIILGVDFGNKKLKDKTLISLIDQNKRDLKDFFEDFEKTAITFCNTEYYNSVSEKSRRFSIDNSYLYWIPMEDLPACN